LVEEGRTDEGGFKNLLERILDGKRSDDEQN
jgi:hypothetical protein